MDSEITLILKAMSRKCHSCSLSSMEVDKCTVKNCNLHKYRGILRDKDIDLGIFDLTDLCEDVIGKCLDCCGGEIEGRPREIVFSDCDFKHCPLNKWIQFVVKQAYNRRGKSCGR